VLHPVKARLILLISRGLTQRPLTECRDGTPYHNKKYQRTSVHAFTLHLNSLSGKILPTTVQKINSLQKIQEAGSQN
jgi:hypothetical protein